MGHHMLASHGDFYPEKKMCVSSGPRYSKLYGKEGTSKSSDPACWLFSSLLLGRWNLELFLPWRSCVFLLSMEDVRFFLSGYSRACSMLICAPYIS
jgi:hypothetical protein